MKKYNIAWVVGVRPTSSESGLAFRTGSSKGLMDYLRKEFNIQLYSSEKGEFNILNSRKRMAYIFLTKPLSLISFLIKEDYHLFIANLYVPIGIITSFMSSLLRKPLLIFDEHWYWRENLLMKLYWPISRLIARHSTCLCVPGNLARKFWISAGLPAEKVRIIRFDVSTIKPEKKHYEMVKKLRSELGNKKVILYFGRLIKRKGIEYLIKAFYRLQREYKDVVLIIAGDGPERKNLRALCEYLGLNKTVYFTGFVKEENKPIYYMLSDVFVCPSITLEMPEIWGLVINEAMSVGKPIIATSAVGAAYDLVNNGINGFIVPEKDSISIYKALRKILASQKLCKKMGENSRKIIYESYMPGKIAEDFVQIIRQIIKKEGNYKSRIP